MKNFYPLLFIILTAPIVGCQKEALPILPEGNDPIYALNGLVDGDSLNLKVGLETVVMNVGVEENKGILTYYGEMENVLKNERFRIEFIRQEEAINAGQHQVFNALSVPFLVHQTGKLNFDFGGVGNQINNFEIRTPSGNFVETDILEVQTYGVHNFEIRFKDYVSEVFNFQVKHGYEERLINSSYNVQGSANVIYLDASYPAFMHEWYIDGQLVGTEASYVGSIEDGISEILHKVIDENGNESISRSLVRFKGGKDFWAMKLNYQPEYEFESYNYGRVVVSMFKSDKWYSSSFDLSNKDQQMSVSDILTINDVDRRLISCNLAFDAQLKTEDMADSLTLSNINGKFLIGLP